MNQQQSFPFMMPFPFATQQIQPRSDLAPARVRLAVEYLNDLTMKGMQRAAATDHNIEIIDGQKLSQDEEDAKEAACSVLTSYFLGKLPPDRWEESKHEGLGPGVVVRCFACVHAGDVARPDCTFCKGCGQLLVFPTTENA